MIPGRVSWRVSFPGRSKNGTGHLPGLSERRRSRRLGGIFFLDQSGSRPLKRKEWIRAPIFRPPTPDRPLSLGFYSDRGGSKDYLWKEYQKGLKGNSRPIAGKETATNAGSALNWGSAPVLLKNSPVPLGPFRNVLPRGLLKKVPPPVTKTGPSRFLGHLEWKEAIIRALRRAGLALAFSQGFHPMPRLSFGPALPVGLSSLGEWMDMQCLGWLGVDEVRKRLSSPLFPGTEVLEVSEVALNQSLPLSQNPHYQVRIAASDLDQEKITAFLSSTQWPVDRPGRKPERIDLRPLIKKIFALPSRRRPGNGHLGPGK